MVSAFVLDASVTIRWVLNDGSVTDRAYADQVLDLCGSTAAWIPALRYTETIHVLRCAEDAGKFGESALVEFSIGYRNCRLTWISLRLPAISLLWRQCRESSNSQGMMPNSLNWRPGVICHSRPWTRICVRRH
ncbi:MAG: PIN domain-containing protein [Sulfuriferula sp.]